MRNEKSIESQGNAVLLPFLRTQTRRPISAIPDAQQKRHGDFFFQLVGGEKITYEFKVNQGERHNFFFETWSNKTFDEEGRLAWLRLGDNPG